MKNIITMMAIAIITVMVLTMVPVKAIEVEENYEKAEISTWFTGKAAAKASEWIKEQRTLDDTFCVMSIDFEVMPTGGAYTVPAICVTYINDTVVGCHYLYW